SSSPCQSRIAKTIVVIGAPEPRAHKSRLIADATRLGLRRLANDVRSRLITWVDHIAAVKPLPATSPNARRVESPQSKMQTKSPEKCWTGKISAAISNCPRCSLRGPLNLRCTCCASNTSRYSAVTSARSTTGMLTAELSSESSMSSTLGSVVLSSITERFSAERSRIRCVAVQPISHPQEVSQRSDTPFHEPSENTAAVPDWVQVSGVGAPGVHLLCGLLDTCRIPRRLQADAHD